jgi:hypothetical protein
MYSTVGSATEIVNLALHHLGHEPVGTLNDITKGGTLARADYGPTRDALMRGFTWNFAITRVAISAAADAPVWGYAYKYALPQDCLRLLELESDAFYEWKVEGNYVLTDITSPANARYIKRSLAVGEYDPFFVQALAARLAMMWVEPLSKSTTLAKQMGEMFVQILREAVSADSIEGTSEVIDASDWLQARVTGTVAPLARLQGDPQPL